MDLHKLIGQLFIENVEQRVKIEKLEQQLKECETWLNSTHSNSETVLNSEVQ